MKINKPKMTVLDLLCFILKDHNIDFGMSTIGDILKDWRCRKNGCLTRRCRTPDRRKTILNMTSLHITPPSTMRCWWRKPKSWGNNSQTSYSRGWLHRFKQRREAKLTEQIRVWSRPERRAATGRCCLRPRRGFYLDKVGLFYCLGPNLTLATSSGKRVKQSKDRIIIALTANATGSVKIKPVVIVKVARQRCIWKKYNLDTNLHYH